MLDVCIAPPSQGVLILLFNQSSALSSKDFEASTVLQSMEFNTKPLASLPKKDKLDLEEMAKNLPYAILVFLSHFHQLSESLLRLRLVEYIPSGYRLLRFKLVSIFTFLSFKLCNGYDSVKEYTIRKLWCNKRIET